MLMLSRFSGERIIDFVDYEIGSNLKDDEVIEIDGVEIKNQMMELLKEQYEDFMINQYHQTLFGLYYFDNLNLKQIEKLTGLRILAKL